MSDGIVIAGGGLAAQRAAETLRREGYGGRVRMLSAESHLPYNRPPLSKELLCGEAAPESLSFRPLKWYDSNDVELLPGAAATELRPHEHRIGLSTGQTLRYDKLLIATGSRPRRLPELDGDENVHFLRTIEDTVALRQRLQPGGRLVVIGAGFIGLEAAASARRLGAEVTLIEAASQPLVGVLGERLGEWFADLHRSEDVEVITGRTVRRAHGNGRVCALHLSDGTLLEPGEVLVGVGVEPDIAWLAGTPLAVGGVRTDAHGRSTVADVYAAGDVTVSYSPAGRHLAGSHWEAAVRMATRAARVMLGLDPGKVELSSFWTDQYGVRIQYLGHAPLADDMTIDGIPEDRDFTAVYTRAGQPVAGLLVNRPRSLPTLREQIHEGVKYQ